MVTWAFYFNKEDLMTFREFLKTIRDEDSPEGDFANDFLSDYMAKGVQIKSHIHLRNFLLGRGCEEARQAGFNCVSRWEAKK
jgi:hypothetical protein